MKRFPVKLCMAAALCAAMALPAFAGDSHILVAASKGKKKAAEAAPAGDIQAQLDTFARKHLENMSKHSIKSGSGFTTYDLKSLRTSYKPSSNPAVQYIGTLEYDEVTYPCKGCPPSRTERLKELIMYVKGKWTY